MILIDSGIFFRLLNGVKNEFDNAIPEVQLKIARHTIISNIIKFKEKFSKTYGDNIVICEDTKDFNIGGYWRKNILDCYKDNRKKTHSDPNIKIMFDTLKTVKKEIAEIFPYLYISVAGAEADDIIASLCFYNENKHNDPNDIFDDSEKVLIISHDHDMQQLTRNTRVDFFDITKNKIKRPTGKELKELIYTHILKGDRGDGVPNIFSDDDSIVNEDKRQKPVSKKIIESFILNGESELEKYDEEIKKNYERNKNLVLLNRTPEYLKEKIIKEYEYQLENKKSGDIMGYVTKNKLIQVFDLINKI